MLRSSSGQDGRFSPCRAEFNSLSEYLDMLLYAGPFQAKLIGIACPFTYVSMIMVYLRKSSGSWFESRGSDQLRSLAQLAEQQAHITISQTYTYISWGIYRYRLSLIQQMGDLRAGFESLILHLCAERQSVI